MFIENLTPNAKYVQQWISVFTGLEVAQFEGRCNSQGKLVLQHPPLNLENPLLAFRIVPKLEFVENASPPLLGENNQNSLVSMKVENHIGLNTLDPQGSEMFFYPNPVKEVLYIESRFKDRTKYMLFDTRGRQMAQGIMQSGINQVDFTSFPTGSYTLLLLNKTSFGSHKIIKP